MDKQSAEAGRDGDAGDVSLAARVGTELKEWAKTLLVFVPAFFLFSLLLFEQRVIPSESMVPALQVGDRVAVAKYEYGYSRFSVPWEEGRFLPFGEGRIFADMPERGDVAVFMHPHTRRVMIKRIIGLPGDRVQMVEGVLHLDGEAVPTELVRELGIVEHNKAKVHRAMEYRETVGGRSWLVHRWAGKRNYDDTPVFIVPEGHFLFMGDNRDNSIDGRALTGHCAERDGVIDRAGCPLRPGISPESASVGFVPFDHLMGEAETVIISFHRCRTHPAHTCPEPRLWRRLATPES